MEKFATKCHTRNSQTRTLYLSYYLWAAVFQSTWRPNCKHLPSGESMPAAPNMAVVADSSIMLTPPTIDAAPVTTPCPRAACVAIREDEQAVSA